MRILIVLAAILGAWLSSNTSTASATAAVSQGQSCGQTVVIQVNETGPWRLACNTKCAGTTACEVYEGTVSTSAGSMHVKFCACPGGAGDPPTPPPCCDVMLKREGDQWVPVAYGKCGDGCPGQSIACKLFVNQTYQRVAVCPTIGGG